MQRSSQPCESAPPTNRQVREEIQNFLRAVDSYPDRVRREPTVTFRQHLSSFIAAVDRRQGEHNQSRPQP